MKFKMQDKNENEEQVVDVKGTLKSFIEEEMPELSQEDAIKAYKGNNSAIYKKNKKSSSSEDEEAEDDEHLKRVKKELLESLERVNLLEKKIFDEKSKQNLKDLRVKSKDEKSKDRQKVIDQMRQKVQEQERSREE